MEKLTANEFKALETAAAAVGVPTDWLYNIIRLESGWNPAIENTKTRAKGLIQFMPDTARGLGYKDQFDLYAKHPTRESQLLGPVIKYLNQWKPFSSEQSFYMSVLYPALRFKPADTILPANVQKYNPGLVTIADYVRKIKRLPAAGSAAVAGVILLIGLTGFFLYKHFQSQG